MHMACRQVEEDMLQAAASNNQIGAVASVGTFADLHDLLSEISQRRATKLSWCLLPLVVLEARLITGKHVLSASPQQTTALGQHEAVRTRI